MTKKEFELNASVHFIYDGYEFEARQSRENPNGTWYLYHYSLSNGDEKISVVSNPFTSYDEFLFEAEIGAKHWIKKNT